MKYKQILASVISAALLLGQAACSQGSKPAEKKEEQTGKEKVELTFALWNKNQKATIEEMAALYEKANPNVKIKVQLTPTKEYWTKLEAAAAGGTAPDVFLAQYFAFGQLS